MSRLFFNLVIFLSALMCWDHGRGFALNIQIDPPEVNGFLHDKFTITCQFDGTLDRNITEIVLLQVSKDGRAIAIFRSNTKLTLGKGLAPRVQGEGNISKNISENYLRVTVSKPTKEDAGEYTCVFYFLGLNIMSGAEEARRSARLTVRNYDMDSTLKFLYEKVALLESALSKEQQESKAKDARIAKMEKEHTERITALENNLGGQNQQQQQQPNISATMVKRAAELKKSMSLLKKRMSEQEMECSNNTDWIDRLIIQVKIQEKKLEQQEVNLKVRRQQALEHLGKFDQLNQTTLDHLLSTINANPNDNVTEFFSAVHKKSGNFESGNVFVYGDVTMSQGQGYDKDTGIFTAPMAGYYLFHLSINAFANTWLYVDLNSNKGQMFLRLFAGDLKDREDFSHGSCVAKLEAGEEVKPIIFNTDAKYVEAAAKSIGSGRINHFSGYLLKAL